MEAEKLYMPDERLRTINAWQRRKLREQEEEIEELQKELAWEIGRASCRERV